MRLKKDENNLLWESYMGKRFRDEDAEDDLMDDEFSDDFEGDFDDDMGDDFGDDDLGMEPEAQGMVMEIEPMAPVEAHETNEVLVSELKKLSEYAGRLYEMKDSAEFEDWMVSAITIASTYVSDVWHRLDAKADFANTGFENVNEGYDVGHQDYDELEYDSDEMSDINIPDSTTDWDFSKIMRFRRDVNDFIHGDDMRKMWAKDSLKKTYMKYKNDPAFIYEWKSVFGNDKI